MAGPWLLDEESIALLESQPGVYVLGRERAGSFYGLYAGRADSNLREQVRVHLPGRETDVFIQLYGPDRFCFKYTATAYEAFHIECTLYHSAQYPANLFHPDPGEQWSWECPVCGRGIPKVLEPLWEYVQQPARGGPSHG